ncbi:hypothetical protein IMSAG049_01723 [Clostridiales bacterium]|nr:hypothetical protein IMSAG049_01723 [Clostridiales bacterium]
MKKLKPLKEIKAPHFILYPTSLYPVVYENENTYYARVMNIKFGLDKKLENELYIINEEA